jgi:hypothetical protein
MPRANGDSFWKSLPGKATAVVGFVAAVIGVIVGLQQLGVGKPEPLSGIKVRSTSASSYRGPCPALFAYRGEISVTEGSGTVAWRLVLPGGEEFPTRKLKFDEPGTRPIAEQFRIYRSGVTAVRFDVVDPESSTSELADFRSECV